VCRDNAAAGSFWSRLQTGLYHHLARPARIEAKRAVGAWIEDRYNRLGRYSPIGMLGSVPFEALRPSPHEPPDGRPSGGSP
jgi:transposase InsO family protein